MPTMRDRAWVWAQFAVAGVLAALSLIGILGVVVFDAAELAFSFAGAIHAFAVFPGLVLSLVLNALLMRAHRELGLTLTEKWLLGVEFALIAWLLVLHFWSHSGDALGLAIITWPVVIILAIVIAILAAARNTSRPAVAPPPPVPPA
jgi:ABC-type proline/glycine betaine transport system permease subunit